jgi:hypothetical protein
VIIPMAAEALRGLAVFAISLGLFGVPLPRNSLCSNDIVGGLGVGKLDD